MATTAGAAAFAQLGVLPSIIAPVRAALGTVSVREGLMGGVWRRVWGRRAWQLSSLPCQVWWWCKGSGGQRTATLARLLRICGMLSPGENRKV